MRIIYCCCLVVLINAVNFTSVYENQPDFGGLFNYARTGTDEFQLTMNRLSSQTREGFVMKIPSNC